MGEIGELYEKNVKCPVCNMEFKTKKVRISRLQLIKKDKDFLSYYKEENPLKYNIFVCPHCGYAASESKYNSITDKDREIVLKEITSKWNSRDYAGKRTVDDAIDTYKLALYIGQLLDYKRIDLGSLCLSIAWLYRIKEDLEEEKRFLKLAKNLFEEGYYKESLEDTNMEELRLDYLLGEISRRLGDKEGALKWFNTTLSSPKLKSKPVIEKMVRQQWRLTREV